MDQDDGFRFLFWVIVALGLPWSAYLAFGILVVAGDHPMAAKGDLLFELRLICTALPILLPLAIWCRSVFIGPTPIVIFRWACLALVASFVAPYMPRIDNGYHQTYWLGDTRYEIPWQFSPRNGSERPGGASFVVVVYPPAFTPRYDEEQRSGMGSYTLSASTDYRFGKGGTTPAELCSNQFSHFLCEWTSGGRVYGASGRADAITEDLEVFTAGVEELFENFKAGTN